jgi:hypothetical protein
MIKYKILFPIHNITIVKFDWNETLKGDWFEIRKSKCNIKEYAEKLVGILHDKFD